ncbi:hypothetical protein PV421_16375 [Streptomyces scabiei]|nr:hypothetical protein [Streptomyces scabiei]
MEHIPDDKGVLAEMVRVLRPGGPRRGPRPRGSGPPCPRRRGPR